MITVFTCPVCGGDCEVRGGASSVPLTVYVAPHLYSWLWCPHCRERLGETLIRLGLKRQANGEHEDSRAS